MMLTISGGRPGPRQTQWQVDNNKPRARDSPGGPEAKTPGSPWRGCRFAPWSGDQCMISQAANEKLDQVIYLFINLSLSVKNVNITFVFM